MSIIKTTTTWFIVYIRPHLLNSHIINDLCVPWKFSMSSSRKICYLHISQRRFSVCCAWENGDIVFKNALFSTINRIIWYIIGYASCQIVPHLIFTDVYQSQYTYNEIINYYTLDQFSMIFQYFQHLFYHCFYNILIQFISIVDCFLINCLNTSLCIVFLFVLSAT